MTTHSSIKVNNRAPFAVFLAAIVMIFFCTVSAADSIGFVPDYIDGTTPTTSVAPVQSNSDYASATDTSSPSQEVSLANLPILGESTDQTPTPTPAPVATPTPVAATSIKPVRIIISAGNIDLPVQNPTTTNVDTLDTLLKHGPAHYINSADLGVAGNLIIFAHSSHLPVVINKMYQAFNNIPKLKSGDAITIVGSDGNSYVYNVVSVVKASVNDGLTIDTSPAQGTNLTLVTCDTLTGVSARFVLSATFVGVSSTTN
jgi:LPXTG-site transpeptidase (sortase) family protein